MHILLIQEPEGTRQEGYEFKARLGYLEGLRSGSVFKKEGEEEKTAVCITSAHGSCREAPVLKSGLGYIICDSPRNKRDLLWQTIGNNEVAVIP